MRADFCLEVWLFAMCICMTLTYTIPDDGLSLASGTESTIYNGDGTEKAMADDNLGLAARKSLHGTLSKPSAIGTPRHEDFNALIKALGTHTDKLDTRTLLPDKRAHMNDAFETITELLKANANTLDTLTGDLNTLTGDVQMMKANADSRLDTLTGDVNTFSGDFKMMISDLMTKLDEFKTISELQKVNADTLDTLTGDVEMMKSEIMTKLNEFKTISDLQKANGVKLDNLTSIPDKTANMSDQLNTISEILKGNARKLYILTKLGHTLYQSCLDYRRAGYTTSGEYVISIPRTKNMSNVYCDQETDGGGWLVFQRRQDGSVEFYRDWADYKAGFGETSGEFWLGNDHLHSLTKDKQELRVDLVDHEGNTAYARYSTFAVGSESEKYALTVTGYSGTAGDSLRYHTGMAFSTKDRDNDRHSSLFCPHFRKGAWWYNACATSNLNGIFYNSAKTAATGITWRRWKDIESLKKSEMKIRPKQ